MPTTGCARTPISGKIVDVSILLGGSQRCCLVRIETDSHHVKLLPGLEIHNLERGYHSVEHLITEHRALVINQRQHHRLLSEVVAQLYLRAILVFEHEIKRELFVEFLINAYALKNFGQTTRRARLIRSRTIKRRVPLRLAELGGRRKAEGSKQKAES